MSQYNKTVLTNAGLELAKRANAGQAKFEITRAVTSADDWSNKTIQDLEAVTAIPNIMQQGTVMDTEEVESNNSVIGVSLCFANKDLSAGYQIKIIGLYVKEEGQDKDFLYAVTTAVTPEYMPDFNDKVLYRFNMQMYLVIGKAQAVNVVINDGASVTHGQFDKYKSEVTANLEKIENAHKEDMSHVVKSASINGGDEILPDGAGKLELVVPAPDLSKYVSLEQLTEALKTKADITAIPDKTATEEGIKQAKELAQEADTKAQSALDNKADKTTVEENLAAKANQSDLDQTNAEVAKKANSADIYTKTEVDSKTSGTVVTAYDIASKNTGKETNSYTNYWLVDQRVLSPFADQINQLKGRRTVDAPDFNTLTDSGVYLISSPDKGKNFPIGSWGVLVVFNGDSQRTEQIYFTDDGASVFMRTYGWINGTTNWCNWNQIAWKSDIIDLQNQIQQLKDNQFEVQTFTDATAAANWEAQRPGKRMAIVNQ
ncbi:pyocin knob domain-containing protein [Lactobacillus amylovorus]|uniref:pyocin knob domain-containing protein n=1 Tax=Lactobacillus amylovorus TaxID=1604 RepID=UPI0023301323|nr:pyocin knob domain-containing protein [Lactobacillus amylovorus]MDB6248235.1 pyocin knob domain-containing protein [Lactobacillus amylovorus]